jgi:hypothetical protein
MAQNINARESKPTPSVQRLQRPNFGSYTKLKNDAVSKKNTGVSTQNTPYNFMFDYQSMPVVVQQRIAFNKRSGKPLGEGVYKVYKILYKDCHSTEQARSKLSVLQSHFSPIGIDMVSDGVINVMVKPEVSSVSLKEAIGLLGLTVNFISETYIVL